MKTLTLLLLFLPAVLFAENRLVPDPIKKDSLITIAKDSALSDTVNLTELVQKQIQNAQTGIIKSSFNFQAPEEVKKPVVKPVVTQKKSSLESIVIGLNQFNIKYTNVTIFIGSSLFILIVFFLRRWIKHGLGISKNRLKKAVNIIRQEKPVFITDKKLNQLRKKFFDSSEIYEISEGTVSGRARQLNMGKGELILAAKVKAVQLSKVSK